MELQFHLEMLTGENESLEKENVSLKEDSALMEQTVRDQAKEIGCLMIDAFQSKCENTKLNVLVQTLSELLVSLHFTLLSVYMPTFYSFISTWRKSWLYSSVMIIVRKCIIDFWNTHLCCYNSWVKWYSHFQEPYRTSDIWRMMSFKFSIYPIYNVLD